MKRILCFGDSNTWGHNPENGEQLDDRWTEYLKELVNQYDIAVDGACGRSTEFDVPDMAYSNGIEVFKERYIEKDSSFDLIIIMLGTNDQLKYFDCTAMDTALALKCYVEIYRQKYGSETKFLLVSPILIDACALKHPVFSELYSEKSVEQSKLFGKVISEIAKSSGADFLDASKYAHPSGIDGIHMDKTEHKKLADAIACKVKEILR